MLCHINIDFHRRGVGGGVSRGLDDRLSKGLDDRVDQSLHERVTSIASSHPLAIGSSWSQRPQARPAAALAGRWWGRIELHPLERRGGGRYDDRNGRPFWISIPKLSPERRPGSRHRGCGQWRRHAVTAALRSWARHCPSAPATRSAEPALAEAAGSPSGQRTH